MDQRPPGRNEPPPDPTEPGDAPRTEPAPMPWERPQNPPPDQPRSTIISADPVLSNQPVADAPEVAWVAPSTSQERAVPGAEGLVFADTPSRFVALLLDTFLIGLATIAIATAVTIAAGVEPSSNSTFYAIFSVISVALSLVYFVLFWTGSRRATPGMRALQLQVGTAFDGRTLDMRQALIRWALLGYPLNLVALVPALANVVSGLGLIWYIALLVSTIASDTKQGIHDRAASSAVVKPAGLGRSGAVTACLFVVIAFVVLWFVAIVGLLFLGGQISSIMDASQAN